MRRKLRRRKRGLPVSPRWCQKQKASKPSSPRPAWRLISLRPEFSPEHSLATEDYPDGKTRPSTLEWCKHGETRTAEKAASQGEAANQGAESSRVPSSRAFGGGRSCSSSREIRWVRGWLL